MNRQETIENDIRMVLGDLMLQLVMARAEITVLKSSAVEAPVTKPNGKQEAQAHGRQS
jgi:hypothetical protein